MFAIYKFVFYALKTMSLNPGEFQSSLKWIAVLFKETDLVAPVLVLYQIVRFLSKLCGSRNKGKNDVTVTFRLWKSTLYLFLGYFTISPFIPAGKSDQNIVGFYLFIFYSAYRSQNLFSTIIAKQFWQLNLNEGGLNGLHLSIKRLITTHICCLTWRKTQQETFYI